MMRCEKYDAYLRNGRTEFAEKACSDPQCRFCRNRPEAPTECSLGPCISCRWLETFRARKKLAGLYTQARKDPRVKGVLTVEKTRCPNDARKNRLTFKDAESGEPIAVFDGAVKDRYRNTKEDPLRSAEARETAPLPGKYAHVWWLDFLEDLPEDAETAPLRIQYPEVPDEFE